MSQKALSEVLKELKSLKHPIEIGPATLRNYWKKGLAPRQVRKGGGRAMEASYPFNMAAEVGASFRLLNEDGLSAEGVARARAIAKHLERPDIALDEESLQNDRTLKRLVKNQDLVAFAALKWLRLKLDLEEELYGVDSTLWREAEKVYGPNQSAWLAEEEKKKFEEPARRMKLREQWGPILITILKMATDR